MNASFLDLANPITPEVMQVLNYFCKDTTERILINLARMKTHSTGTLARSVHAVVYNNAGGNDALVRFYYMNYGSYIEHAVGRYFEVDDEIKKLLGRKGGKDVGIKSRNVEVPEIAGSNFDPLGITLKGVPNKITSGKHKGKERTDFHKAKPAINSEIRLHLRGTTDRLAKTLAFTATAYIMRGMVMGMIETKDSDATAIGRQHYNDRHIKDEGFKRIDESGYSFNFVPDWKGEDAWLATKGYLKQIQYGWRLSSVSKDILNM